MKWYAICVEVGQESMLEKELSKRFSSSEVKVFVPKKVVPEKKNGVFSDKVKVLLPGYVLIQTKIIAEIYYCILEFPRVYYWVKCGQKKIDQSVSPYSEIPDDELSGIHDLLGHHEVVDYSEILVEGKEVKVISGPLKGKEAIIKKIDKRKRRAKILIYFFDKMILLDVGIRLLGQFSTEI
ncbi:antiterminator LoaP [Bacillus paralicheniformis]|uniref:antiterminator LoaP n=1 Tax=Bacillus paralicheniformis TaxID=1648923 RepID=UPI000D043ABE|nr:antiterminator LoaP [Bacillus paralicheniformis]